MGLKNWQGQGPNYVPAYQASGTPFVTSSVGATVTATPQKIRFPSVTRFVEIINTGGGGSVTGGGDTLRIGFSEHGVNGTGASVSGSTHERVADHANYFVLFASGSTGRLELRCKELYLRRGATTDTGFTLVAGLTGIQEQQFPVLTGSSGFVGIG